jgi:general secretion pathway protein D
MAQTPAPTPDGQSLNVQNADIRALIQDVSRATGRTFVIDPRVQGQVTIASGGPMTDEQMYEVFLATLRANGYVVLPTASGALRIAPDEDAARQPAGSGAERYVTQVIRLQTRDASAVLPVLQPLMGRGGQVSAAERSNAIVITDFADNVRRLAGLVRDLDRDTDTIDILTLRNSRASVLAAAMREIIGGGADGAKSIPSATFTPVDASNSLVIRGPAETVARLRQIASSLDDQAKPTGDTRVIFLQHADAEQMVELLQVMLDQPARLGVPASGGPSGPGGPTQGAPSASLAGISGASQRGAIARYEGANAIVVRGDPGVQQEIESIVNQLDRRAEQVLVQAIVVEMSDDATRDLGVQFLLSGQDGSTLPFFATSFSNAQPNLLALSAALLGGNALPEDSRLLDDLRTGAVNSLVNSRGGVGGFGGEDGDTLFGGILNLLQRDTGSNLLSTPSIVTLNNREASILVGQEVPITTGEVLSNNNSNPFRTIERKDVGIKLRVRPQINTDGAITLDIRQEVSSISPSATVSAGEFVFNKREIETSVLVDNGEIVVLGGLLDQGERITAEKVPGLGDVPVLGRLFRSDQRDAFKTNLVIFIRPVVLKSAADARRIAGGDLSRMSALQRETDRQGVSMLDDLLARLPPATQTPAPAGSSPPSQVAPADPVPAPAPGAGAPG